MLSRFAFRFRCFWSDGFCRPASGFWRRWVWWFVSSLWLAAFGGPVE